MKIFDFLHGLVLSMFLSSWLCISFATPVKNVERYANIKNEVSRQQRCRLSVPKLSYAVNHRHLLNDLDEDNNEFFDTDTEQNNEIENITETVKSQECCNHESNQVSLTESISNDNNNIDSSNINKDNNQKQNEETYSVNSRKDTSKSNDKEVHSRRKRSLSNSKELQANKLKENGKRSALTNKLQGKSVSSLKSSSHNEQELDNKAVDSNSDENEPLIASDNADYVGEVEASEYQKNQVSLMSNEDNSINQDERSFYDEFEGKEIVKRDADDPRMDYEGVKVDEEGNEENVNDNRIKRDEEVDIKFKDQPIDVQLPKEGSLDEKSVESKSEEEVAERKADNLKEEDIDVSKPNFNQDVDNSKSTNDKIVNEEENGVYERSSSALDNKKLDSELNKNSENNKLEIKPLSVAALPNVNVLLKSEVKPDQLKTDESEAEYEKRVEEQIQRKIDSIKEEIKREIEEKQKLKEIEANNARFDELQKQLEETEEQQNSEEQKSEMKHIASKRSAHHTNQVKKKRSPKKIKRSEHERNVRELRKIENVENLSSDDYRASLVDHESIRKRSAARFNEIEKMPGKKREFVRRVYLVQDGYPSGRRRKKRSRSSISNQVRSKPESDSSANHNLNSRERENGKGRKVRMNKNVAKHLSKRKRSEKMTEGGTKILKYSPENINEDDDEEGNEFDDDGFEDRTSNLRSWNSDDKPRSVKRSRHIYKVKSRSADYPEDFLFSGFHQKSHLQSNRKRNKR